MASDRPHPRIVDLRKKRKLLDVTLSATQYLISRRKCAISRARSTREPIDRYRTIINMTVRYLKNLSFYATCTFKYKCTRKMYIVLLPLRTSREIAAAKSSYGEYILEAG